MRQPSWLLSWLPYELHEYFELRAEAKEPPPPPPPATIHPPAGLRVKLLTPQEAVERALADVGRPSRYRLGGGADPLHHGDLLADDGTSDCSGATAYWSGHARSQVIGGRRISYYTDNIIRDAYDHGRDGISRWIMTGPITPGPRHLYRPVEGDDELLGSLLVTPGRYKRRGGAWRRVKIGHVRMVVGIRDGFVRGQTVPGREWWRFIVVVDCSPNRGARSAIRRRVAAKSARSAVATSGYLIRPKWYV